MALPRHAPGADPQMPDMRGRLRRVVHRPGRFGLNRPMDPNRDAGVLSDIAGISRFQTLAAALQSERICGSFRFILSFGNRNAVRSGEFVGQSFLLE